MNYPHPKYRLVVNGQDISALVNPRLISISLKDNRDLEADTLDIQISDHDGKMAIPPHNAEVQLWLGWSDTGLVYKGLYLVDESEHSGAPDVLSIRARSADLRASMKEKRDETWREKSLQEILSTIAGRHELELQITGDLMSEHIDHLDQTSESDLAIIARLASEHDATVTVKNGVLIFIPIGSGKLPHMTITRSHGDNHRFLIVDRNQFSTVKAYYHENNNARRKSVTVGGDKDGSTKELRHTHRDKKAAEAAAKSELDRLQRNNATLSYTLARGLPDLMPEQTFSLIGIKPEIEAVTWLGVTVTHNLSESGYTTSLELEKHLG